MALTEIIQFHIETPVDNDNLQNALKALQGNGTPRGFVIGTHIQDLHSIQVTAEWDDAQESKAEAWNSNLVNTLRSSFGNPEKTFHIPFNTGSVFQTNGPATSNVVEYVQLWFPASRITADFQHQIEQDFMKFDDLFNSGGPRAGQGSLAYGWVQEEQTHADIPDEKAKCFFITRGWDAMSDFEQSLQTEAYQKAIPILLAWGAPFKMVSVVSHC
jgi:hypothetical protein